MFRTRLSFWDIAAALTVLFLACLLLWAPWKGRRDGAFLLVSTPTSSEKYVLSDDREIYIEEGGYTLVIVIEDGAAYVHDSSCPDKLCKSLGRISHSGETVVCAPAGVSLKILGGEEAIDYVAG